MQKEKEHIQGLIQEFSGWGRANVAILWWVSGHFAFKKVEKSVNAIAWNVVVVLMVTMSD